MTELHAVGERLSLFGMAATPAEREAVRLKLAQVRSVARKLGLSIGDNAESIDDAGEPAAPLSGRAAELLRLLAEHLEAEAAVRAYQEHSPRLPPCDPVAVRAGPARRAVWALDPAELRAQAEALDTAAQIHWKAGFLRGAKWWYGQQTDTQGCTMWADEQHNCWKAAHALWPPAPGRLDEAGAVVQAQQTSAAAP